MGSIRSDGCQSAECELFQQQSEGFLNRTRVMYAGKQRIGFNEAFSLELLLISTLLHHTITSQRHEKLTKDKKNALTRAEILYKV